MRTVQTALLFVLVTVIWLVLILWANPSCPSGAPSVRGVCLEGVTP